MLSFKLISQIQLNFNTKFRVDFGTLNLESSFSSVAQEFLCARKDLIFFFFKDLRQIKEHENGAKNMFDLYKHQSAIKWNIISMLMRMAILKLTKIRHLQKRLHFNSIRINNNNKMWRQDIDSIRRQTFNASLQKKKI